MLFAVDAVSATDAWIVGLKGTATTWRAHSWRWDGSTWSSEPVPALPSGYRSLRAVDAVATDDAWAVGSSSDRRSGDDRPLERVGMADRSRPSIRQRR